MKNELHKILIKKSEFIIICNNYKIIIENDSIDSICKL